MLDEIRDLFDRGKRRRETGRSQPSRGVFDVFGGDEDDIADDARRSPRDEDRHGASRRDSHERRDRDDLWD